MKHLAFRICALCLVTMLLSCSGNGAGFPSERQPAYAPGIVYKQIPCTCDTSVTYALYIPINPNDADNSVLHDPIKKEHEDKVNKGFPVIIAFDPHGDGTLPVNLYKSLADKYGYLMIGSNDARNGLQPEQLTKIVSSLFNEVFKVLPADTLRIYLLGFSGGARVASLAAMYQFKVNGVIGCGAGLGTTGQPIRFQFDYYGMAGTADFNMNELIKLGQPLTSAGFRHFIATFPGNHAWPPVDAMENGVRWITLNSMKDHKIATDKKIITEVIVYIDTLVTESIRNKRMLDAANGLNAGISMLEDLSPTDHLNKKLAGISLDPEYLSQSAYRNDLLIIEDEEKQVFIDALQSKKLEWWTNRLKKVTYTKGSRFKNQEDSLKECRLLSFLSLVCYMNLTSPSSKMDNPTISKVLSVYELADPVNPEPNYLRAVVLASHGESGAAVNELMVARQKGFSDKLRLSAQPEFQRLNTTPGWLELMNIMK